MSNKKYIKLDSKQEAMLRAGYLEKSSRKYSQRCHALLLSNQGKTTTEIKEILGIKTIDTISSWFRNWRKSGLSGLKDKPKSGRPSKLDVANDLHVKVVKKALSEVVTKGTCMHSRIEDELKIELSKKTLKRFLKNLNLDGNG